MVLRGHCSGRENNALERAQAVLRGKITLKGVTLTMFNGAAKLYHAVLAEALESVQCGCNATSYACAGDACAGGVFITGVTKHRSVTDSLMVELNRELKTMRGELKQQGEELGMVRAQRDEKDKEVAKLHVLSDKLVVEVKSLHKEVKKQRNEIDVVRAQRDKQAKELEAASKRKEEAIAMEGEAVEDETNQMEEWRPNPNAVLAESVVPQFQALELAQLEA